MRLAIAAVWLGVAAPGFAGGGAWVAFFREGNDSAAFERPSVTADSVNILSVKPKTVYSDLVVAWDVKTQVHRFNCANNTYRHLTKKTYDRSGKLTADETAVVTAMNDAFKDRWHPVDTETLRKARALVCAKTEPAPAKPFGSMQDALAWMAN